jgi:3-polyprenyl-4-hydroxybenzoate decarboxylase
MKDFTTATSRWMAARSTTRARIAIGTKLGIDATRKLAGEGFKRTWPPLIKMSEEVRRKIDALFGGSGQ